MLHGSGSAVKFKKIEDIKSLAVDEYPDLVHDVLVREASIVLDEVLSTV